MRYSKKKKVIFRQIQSENCLQCVIVYVAVNQKGKYKVLCLFTLKSNRPETNKKKVIELLFMKDELYRRYDIRYNLSIISFEPHNNLTGRLYYPQHFR